MKKMLFSLIILVFPVISAFADKHLDSLYHEYHYAKNDPEKFNALFFIISEYLDPGSQNYNPDATTGLLDKAIEELRLKNDLRLFASFLRLKANAYAYFNKYDMAIQYYDSCLRIAEKFSDYNELGLLYASKQWAYSGLGKRELQIQSLYKSVENYKKGNNLTGEANEVFNLGNIYLKIQQNDLALQSFMQSAEISNKINDVYNSAIAYLFCARAALNTGDFKSAEEFIIKGRPAIESPVLYQPFYYYKIYGSWLKAMNRNEEALRNLKIASDLAVKGHQLYQKPSSLCEMAEIYIYEKKYDTARQFLDEAKTIAYAVNNSAGKIAVSQAFSKYFEAVNIPSRALEEFKLSQSLKDSINQTGLSIVLARTVGEAEYSKKEAARAEVQKIKEELDAKKLKHQKNITYSVGVVILLLGFHASLLTRNYRKQKKAHALLKATQSQLIQSEKMASLGELTAGIAHEIQNPLNFINNFSEVSEQLAAEMKEELFLGNSGEATAIAENLRQNLQKISQHGKRADSIIKRMLQHSKSCTGSKELTNINALADEFLRLTYYGLKAKDENFNVKIETVFDENLSSGKGKINIFPQGIGMVIKNLASNAFYTIAEKKEQNIPGYEPTISLITKRNGKAAEIIIKDNGMGIPRKILSKIYQPFFSTKPTGEGTGLGLSLSYDIVTKAHGGKLSVETKEGEYSAFIVQLPV